MTDEAGGTHGPPPPEALEARLRGLADAVEELAVHARRVGQVEHQQALIALQSVPGAAPDARSVVENAVREAIDNHAPAAMSLVGQLAPGLASLSTASEAWLSREYVGQGVAAHARVGELSVDSVDVPVIAPLLGTTGWQVRSDRGQTAHRLLQSTALRLVASAEPFRLRIDAFDPRLTGAMGLLGHLTTKYPQLVPRAGHTEEQLQTTLSGLVDVSSMRASRMAQLGHRSFEELLRDTGRVTDPYRLLVLFDYPAGVDSRAQRDLIRLAETAADRGICFLVHHDPAAKIEHDVEPAAFLKMLAPVTISGERVELSHLPGIGARLDKPFEAHVAAGLCDVVAELADRAVLPTIEFAGTLPDRADWWQPVRDELSSVIGYDDRTPAEVRLRSGNPALPHVLVGGAVGQGKSNLLLVLIHGLAARYAPGDLEMYLLDFKHGVEFSALGPALGRPHWLPHVRVLGVHSDRPFGLAVLRHLSDELARRSEVFKAQGLADISELPAGPDRPPRILVVLDEFQVLLEDDDELADEAAKLLERLVRLGRAYGVHVVLATQTIEGVKRLATRRDSIFGQVPYRIALKTTPTDSQAILRTGNTAAAELQFRGEAVLNANFGSPDDNQHILVSFADRDLLDKLRHELWTKAEGGRPPRVFNLAEAARLAETVLATRPRGSGATVHAWAGLPIAVTEEPVTVEVRPEPGSGVLVLGDGATDALGALTGLAVSTAVASPAPPRFIVIDGTGGDESTQEGKVALAQTLQRLGCAVEVVDHPDAIGERLFALRDAIKEGQVAGPTYLIGIGMHSVPRMTLHVEGRFESPADALQQIVKDGPSREVITFAWWNRLHVCTEHLGFKRANVAVHLFLRHPQDGVKSVAGPLVRWPSEPHRALLWDGLHPEPPVVVPFAPLRLDEVDRFIEQVVG